MTVQLTEQLFDHVWSQWCRDTQQIASGLPQALANQVPGQPFLVSLERWLILLKVSQYIDHLLDPYHCWHSKTTKYCLLYAFLTAFYVILHI